MYYQTCTPPVLDFRVRIRARDKVRIKVMVRVKNRVMVGMLLRVRVWFLQSVQWMGVDGNL